MNTMSPQPPPNWGKDELTDFCQKAYENGFFSFVHFQDWISRITKVDAALSKASKHLDNTVDLISGLFLMKARASFLGASRLVMSGQLPEAYMLLRSCLENALYGFKIWKCPESAEVWLRRHDDDEHDEKSKWLCREVFSHGSLIRLLGEHDQSLVEKIRKLYDHSIDYGAHPNERSLSSSVRITDNEQGGKRYNVHYFNINETAIKLAFKSTAQVGVCVLMIFQHIFQTRFDIINISEDIATLRRGL